jgi:iron(III) transport system permease protein
VFAASLPFYDGVSLAAFGRLTSENFHRVMASAAFRESIFNTLIMGAATATAICLMTAVGAWYAVRRFKGGRLIDQVATIPLVFPAIVLGVAFLQMFLNSPIFLYGTLVSLVIAATVQYTPYGMRFCYAGTLQIHRELEEAAAMSGARRGTTYRRVVLPLTAPSITTAWLFIFLLSVRAVAMPILLTGPKSQVVAVTLFDLWANGQVTELAAVGVTWTGIMMAVGVAFYVVARRYGLTVH